jgi:hypothetical protein|tara:strand:+ start:1091 stop:1444 length:354 start_codon:yes stop_codon:yes gene_type:complete
MNKNIEYNGWTNWETWNLKLWIDNDENLYHEINSLVHANIFSSIIKKGGFDNVDYYKVSTRLHEYFETLTYEKIIGFGFFRDVSIQALNDVNFMEIAKHIVNDLREDEERIEKISSK